MNYYEVLSLSTTATDDEIKRAYRHLVVRYHPDKNPDVHAIEMFRSITEAYEVLSNPDMRQGYDYLLNNRDVAEERPVHRDPAYRPQRAHEATESIKTRAPSLRQLMARYLPYTQKMSISCLVVAMVMMADYVLPKRHSTDRVAYIRVFNSHRYRWSELYTDKGESFVLDRWSRISFDIGDTLLIEKSLAFGIPVAVGHDTKMMRLGSGIYGNFIYLPAILLIISSFGVLTRKNVDWGFNFGVGSLLMLIFIIIIMMVF